MAKVIYGWKDYECQKCRKDFTRRAAEKPNLCFNCEWLESETKKARDLAAFDPGI